MPVGNSTRIISITKEMLSLKRLSDDGVQTLGILTLPNGRVLHTLELAWKDNEKKISCIPKGNYTVVKRTSEKYGAHFHILDVPNRSFILIHHSNFHSDLLGCVAVGTGIKDINKDGRLDVVNSKRAMLEMLNVLPDKWQLQII